MILKDGEITLRPMSLEDTDFIVTLRNTLQISDELFSDPPLYDFVHLNWLKTSAKDNIELIIEFNGEKAGHIRLTDINYRHSKAQLGIMISEKYQNKKIGYKSCKMLIDYVFDKLPINKIYLELFSDNTKASKLYRKLGFEEEGLFKQECFKNGNYNDVKRMALIKESWKKNKQNDFYT